MHALVPFVDWNEYLRKTYPTAQYSSVINNTSDIVIQVPLFLKSLSNLVQRHSNTIEFYTIWCIVSKFAYALPSHLRNEINRLLVRIGAQPQALPEKYSECIKYTALNMGEVYARWFALFN